MYACVLAHVCVCARTHACVVRPSVVFFFHLETRSHYIVLPVMKFCRIDQTGLELWRSLLHAVITGVCHNTWLKVHAHNFGHIGTKALSPPLGLGRFQIICYEPCLSCVWSLRSALFCLWSRDQTQVLAQAGEVLCGRAACTANAGIFGVLGLAGRIWLMLGEYSVVALFLDILN